jgi:hypothetical protein
VLDRGLITKRDAPRLPGTPTAVGLRGDRLVAVAEDGGTAVAVQAQDGSWRVERVQLALSDAIGQLILSRSGQFVLARSRTRDRAVVYDLESGTAIVEVTGKPDVTGSAVTALTSAAGREFVLVSTVGGKVRGHELPGGALMFDSTAPQFVFEHFVPVGGGETLIALGHYLSEGRDSLLTLSMTSLLDDGGSLQRVVNERPGFDDYAYAVAAGPCEPDALVIYRDPEDAERIDEDEEDEEVLARRRDVYGLHGFYFRDLESGALLGQIPTARGIVTGTELFATKCTIVIARDDRVEILDRRDPAAAPVTLTGSVHGLDPERGRVATVTPGGVLEIHDVAG